MDSDLTRLTVFFEAPFWVGVFERFEGGTLSVCKITFGAEPKDYDVLSYVLKNYARLRFSPAVAAAVRQDAANPKRMQREIRRTSSGGVGTKAQQAYGKYIFHGCPHLGNRCAGCGAVRLLAEGGRMLSRVRFWSRCKQVLCL